MRLRNWETKAPRTMGSEQRWNEIGIFDLWPIADRCPSILETAEKRVLG